MKKIAVVACLFLTFSAFASFKHVRLTRSEPMADSTVHASPDTIRLWFSAPVQIAVTSVRVVAANGDTVQIARPVMGPGRDAPVLAAVRAAIPAGRASVSWRTMSRDGHVISGTFNFTVADEHAH